MSTLRIYSISEIAALFVSDKTYLFDTTCGMSSRPGRGNIYPVGVTVCSIDIFYFSIDFTIYIEFLLYDFIVSTVSLIGHNWML